MKWHEHIKKILTEIQRHYIQDRKSHREDHLNHENFKADYRRLQSRQREYQRQLKILLRRRGNDHTDKRIEILNKIAEIRKEQHELRFKQHINRFHGEGADLDHYYRHVRYKRPIILVFNLLLWFLLFWYGGFATGLKIAFLLLAFLITVGSIFELIFSIRIEDRILIPVNNLKKGVTEIARGNYDIEIPIDTTSEITSLIKAFNEMAQKLKESELLQAEYEDNRKSLVANISHDLKTPITSIQGYIEVITETTEMSREKLERYLKIIHSNSLYMNRLIDDLFLFSKLDMQKLDFHFEEVKVGPFIEDMMEEFKLDLEEKAIAFEFSNLLPDDYIVRIDTKRYYQIIRNIIGNAEKHSSEGYLKINTRLFESKGSISLDIADNGPGITEENLAHIFERFYRAESGRTKDLSSTGLGLAISKELIAAHGGNIAVSSKINEGSLFTVSLPYIKTVTIPEGELNEI